MWIRMSTTLLLGFVSPSLTARNFFFRVVGKGM